MNELSDVSVEIHDTSSEICLQHREPTKKVLKTEFCLSTVIFPLRLLRDGEKQDCLV